MKSVALVVASLFTVTAFAAEPAKKDAKKVDSKPAATAPAKDAKPAAAPAKKEEKKEAAKK